MDGRKNNKGTKGNNGGRKPKADEIKLIEQMDAVAAPKEVWQRLFNKVKEDDVQAIKTWLQYRFGMPKQQVEQTNVNYNQELTKEDIKKINDTLENVY